MAKVKKEEYTHEEALERYKKALNADKENRERSLEDAEFCAGKQWPDAVENKRKEDGRPCLTINRMPAFVRQVSNEVRMKPPSIQVIPAEDGDMETAQVIEGMIRAIEAKSKAKRIYSKTIEDSARCNRGFMRVTTDYVDDKSFDQDIMIKSIDNPLSVLFDPDMTDPMGSDAEFCFVDETISREAAEAKFDGEDVSSMDGDKTTNTSNQTGWSDGDDIRIAEYWYVKKKNKKIVLLEDGQTADYSEYEKVATEYNQAISEYELNPLSEPPPQLIMPKLDAKGKPITRDVIERKVCSRLMSGKKFLTQEAEWAGTRIPIVPCWGEEFRVGERKLLTSVITWAKDSQRMINYWRSASVEALALAPKAPWLVTPNQVKGHENMWKSAGNANPSVLFYNPDPQAAGRPDRINPPPVQAAMLQEAALAQDDLKATTGIFDAALGAQSNETSGKAIIARQREGDVSTYAFLDNLLHAVEEIGRIIVDILPKIYDTPRQVRILGKKMESAIVKVNNEGSLELAKGRYDVHISTGSSVTTQRQEKSEAFLSLVQTAPSLAPILIPRLVEVLDIEDAKEIAEELRAASQNQQPNPKDVASSKKDMATAQKTEVETFGLIQQYGMPPNFGQEMSNPEQLANAQGMPQP